jgi:hypothetical protein
MITKRTVFVLGAGSMKDYGFPIGWELTEKAINTLSSPQQRKMFLECTDFGERELTDFVKALDHSAQNSVDAFLEERGDFLNIGIGAMSMCLIQCEQHEALYRDRDPDSNWLRYLLKQLRGTSFEEFHSNKVGFVTFNYDRSLEYFLARSLVHSFGQTHIAAKSVFEKIPIIHLHGRLGYLPWQAEKEKSRSYNSNIDRCILDLCIKEVKVVNRNTEINAEEFEKARELLAKADRIYFLGVGFNNENLSRLGVMALEPNRAMATGVGLSNREFSLLHSRLYPRLEVKHRVNCIELMREYVDWS